MSEPKLKRNLSFVSMVALASGAVIGGWLAEAPYWFSKVGLVMKTCCISTINSAVFLGSISMVPMSLSFS